MQTRVCGKWCHGRFESVAPDAHATWVIQGCDRVIDLGCDAVTQLVPIALLNPETYFVRAELAANMTDSARLACADHRSALSLPLTGRTVLQMESGSPVPPRTRSRPRYGS